MISLHPNMKLPFKLPALLKQQSAPDRSEGLDFDCALAAGIREGNPVALERLVERHLPRVQRYAEHRLGQGHDDIVWQVVRSTFDDAMRNLGPYARGTATTPFECLLIRMAERNLGKAIKARADEPARLSESEGDLPVVREAIRKLPRRYAFVLGLAIYEGMSPEEIAQTLGMGQARAMRRLRAALREVDKLLPTFAEEAEQGG